MSNQTLHYYNSKASLFTEGTLTADMHVMQEWFLDNLQCNGAILDLGCGTGRDSKFFLSKGYDVVAIDGSSAMCEIAKRNTGLNVRNQLFSDFSDREKYGGVWACASILHLRKDEINEILVKIRDSLKKDGIAYVSFKYGTFEGYRGERYYTDLKEEELIRIVEKIDHLSVKELKVSYDVRPGKENEKWLNALLAKE